VDQQGRPFQIAELCPDRPDSWPRLAELLRGLTQLDQQLHVGETSHPGAGPAPTPILAPLPRDAFARKGYEILGEVGRGGMGVVYRTRQVALKRTVALKMILASSHASPQQLARFRREAELLARLRHPNIVQIHEVGEQDGHPFFCMEYLEGGSLAGRVTGRPQLPRAAAELVETVARAVHAAHEQGVVHRDLKPANILLDAAGVPRITDFGLAKEVHEETGSSSGQIVGTPSHLAPEQVRRDGAAVGPAADIYALGVLLYELLTGRVPHRGENSMETVLLVLQQEPVPPSRLQPRVPRDLETICLKCLQKVPRQRYASAAALAADLEHFLQGEPIQARPVNVWERGWRWARRRPAIAGLLALVVLVTVVGFGLVSWKWLEADAAWQEAAARAGDERHARQEADTQRQEAETRRQEAESERQRAQLMSAGLTLDQGIKLCEEGKTGPGLLWMARALELIPRGAAAEDLDFTIRANLSAWRRQVCPVRLGTQLGTEIPAIAYSPDGKLLLVAGEPPGEEGRFLAILYEAATWKPIRTVPHAGRVCSVAFSPDGRTFATGCLDGTARLWETATGRPLGEPLKHAGPVTAVAFGPDGKTLATGGPSNDPPGKWFGSEVRFWDATTGQPQGEMLRKEKLSVHGLAWAADGRTLAMGCSIPGSEGKRAVGGLVLFGDVARRKLQEVPLWHPEAVNAVAYSPDGKWLATACEDHLVRFWDPRTNHLRRGLVLQHPYPVNAVVFSRDGRRVATGCGLGGKQWMTGDGDARLWDVDTGQLLVQPLVHPRPHVSNKVNSVALSPDGQTLATGSVNGQPCLWDVSGTSGSLPELRPGFVRQQTLSAGLSFSPDGRTLLTNAILGTWPQRGECRLWRTATGAPAGVLPHPTAVNAWFSPDSSRILTVSFNTNAERRLRLWEVATGKPIAVPAALADDVTHAAYSPDGKWLVTGHTDGKARLWDSVSFAPRGPILDHGIARQVQVTVFGFRVAFSPDGKTVLTADEDRVRLWALPDGRPVGMPLTGAGRKLWNVFFSKDGQTILTAWWEGGLRPSSIRLWTAAGQPQGPVLDFPQLIDLAALHPQGLSFLTTGSDELNLPSPARLWDTATGTALAAPTRFRVCRHAAAYHPSGRFLALGGFDEPGRLWSPLGKPIGPPLPHAFPVSQVAFDPTGRWLATAGTDTVARDSTVRLHAIPAPVAGSPADVKLLVEVLTGRELDEAGGVRELAPPEMEARRLRLGKGTAAWPPPSSP
jgi:WD40 repeat protein